MFSTAPSTGTPDPLDPDIVYGGTVERYDTHELLLEIGGARRKVDQQNVELSPLHLMNELPQGRGQERRP